MKSPAGRLLPTVVAAIATLLIAPLAGAQDATKARLQSRAATASQPIKGTNAPGAPQKQVGAEVFGPFEATRFNGDLRKLPAPAAWKPGDAIKTIPLRNNRVGPIPPESPPANPLSIDRDPLLALQEAFTPGAQRAFTTPIRNFGGQGFNGVAPPDTVGAVGMNYYIQGVNAPQGSTYVIYNKSNGTVAAGPIALDTLGSGNCNDGAGDVIVSYDQAADRWVLMEFSSFGNRLCIYVSQVSGNPVTGGWYAYEIAAPSFPDYPKLGVWPDAYYISSNEGNPGTYAIDRSQMLIGAAATAQRFSAPFLTGFGFQSLVPSDHDGDIDPPAGSPNYFMRHRDDERHNPGANDPTRDFLDIFEFRVDFATPASSSLVGPISVAVNEFDSSLCGFTGGACFDQVGGDDLDPLREVIMYRLAYRNYVSHESLVGNFVVDKAFNDQGAIRWFELRRNGGAWTTFQEGTYSPDGENRWMGSIAQDQDGNMALGYSISSTAANPRVAYTGRLATDAAGIMTQPETVVASGLSAQNGLGGRWGDYSAMTIDPVDDCTFWYTQELTSSSGTWNTQVSSFRFDDCGGNPGENCGNGLLDIGETCDDANVADGDGCSSICLVEDGFECTLPIPPGQGGNIVADPSFEAGSPNPFWVETSTNFGTPLCTTALCGGGSPTDGLWFSWFGGVGAFEQATLEQTVTIPAGATTLEFDLLIGICDSPNDFLNVSVDGGQVFSTDPCTPNGAYTRQSVNIAAFADGGSHTLLFDSISVATNGGNSNFFVDQVEIAGGGGPGQPSICTAIPEGCSLPNLAIPDGDPAGISDSIAFTDTGSITDLDVSITTPHTWVGDLIYTLEHEDTGTTVVLIDRPGLPAIDPQFGCSFDNIDVVLDDAAGTSVEDQCSPAPPAIGGTQAPNNPLAAFAGEDISGDWTLSVSDNVTQDTGTLEEWCIVATTSGAPDTDGDGVQDDQDNCIFISNPAQDDSNGDGIGNVCDADVNNDCFVNFVDLGQMKGVFFSSDADNDLVGTGPTGEPDGTVNFVDLGRMKELFFADFNPPGNPSGIPNVCD